MESEDLIECSEKDFELEPGEPEMDLGCDEQYMKSEGEYPQRVTLPIERPQLIVSEEDSCDSNASTIAINDRDVLEWNDDHDESTLPYLQYSEGADDHKESTLPYIPGNVRSSDHDGSTLPYQQGEDEKRMPIMEVVWLEEWFRRTDYWAKTLSKDLHQQPTPELVGTPTEIKGGGGIPSIRSNC